MAWPKDNEFEDCTDEDKCEFNSDKIFVSDNDTRYHFDKFKHKYPTDGSEYLKDVDGNEWDKFGHYYDPETKKLMNVIGGDKYYNKYGKLVDEDDHLIDDTGRRINSKKQLVDKDEKPINEKGERIDSKGNVINIENTTENWVRFLKSLLLFLVITLFAGMVGSGFIYLTTRGTDLDNILPTDADFYRADKIETTSRGPVNVVDCTESTPGMNPVFEDNFPYNMVKNQKDNKTAVDPKTLSLVDRFCNWGARLTGGVFKNWRAIFKTWLNNFTPGSPWGNHVFQLYIAAPITFFCSLIVPIFVFWNAFMVSFGSDPKISVWGCFFMWTWGACMGFSGLIFLRMIGTMVFLPISQDWKEVANIMACNVKPLVILFGFFVCGAAYDALDPIIAGVMGVVYMCLVAWTVFKYFSKQFF